VPQSMTLEADEAVDDLVVELAGGGVVMIQAKRRLAFGAPMHQVVAQWQEALRGRGVNPALDRLVAAGATASEPIQHLAAALRRVRREVRGGALSHPETDALSRLPTDNLSNDELELLRQTALIWTPDLEDPDGLSAKLGQALLEPGVVAAGQGLAAWRLLRDHARDLAANRYGVGLAGLQDLLAADGLTLTAAADGYASARHERRRQIVASYRARLVRDAQQLDLRSLGARFGPIPLGDIDSDIGVGAPDEPGSYIGDLPWGLRRRGRALLIGLPGSGKSVALRHAAGFYAARPTWPLPLCVPCGRLSQLLAIGSFRDAVLDAALTREPTDEQPALREAAIDAILSGEAVLLFDGLDEVRTRRDSLISGLEAFLSEAHPALEALIGTRESALPDAAQLDLRRLVLHRPSRPDHTVAAILRAAANARGLAITDPRAWIETRKEWVADRRRRDKSLDETPLMVVLLTLLASEASTTGELPGSRAEVLHAVVMDVVERWEAGVRLQDRAPELGALNGEDAVKAAQETFLVIGRAVFQEGEADARTTTDAVAALLASRYGLAPGPAETAAAATMRLWDEAGIFVLVDRSRHVRARIRVFSELAEAMHQRTGTDEEVRAFVTLAIDDPDLREPLLLACGLDERFGDALAAMTASDPLTPARVAMWITAIREGALPGHDAIARLVDKAFDDREAELSVRVELLLELPVPTTRQPTALRVLDGMPDRERTLRRAITVDTWRREDNQVDHDLRAAIATDPPPRERNLDRQRFVATPVKPLYERATLIAAGRLLSQNDDALAAQLRPRLTRGLSIRASSRLARILIETGHEVLTRPALTNVANWFSGLANLDFDESEVGGDEARLLRIVSSLSSPTTLSEVQRRRLDALVDLIGTLDLSDELATEVTQGLTDENDHAAVILQVTAQRAGLDLAIVAAQADEMLAAISAEEGSDLDARFTLFDAPAPLELGPWERVSDPDETSIRLAQAVGSAQPWIRRTAAAALEGVRGAPARHAAETLRQISERTTGSQHEQIISALATVEPQL
jgi:hypothetical protein